jgi:hypothetical protein
VAATVCSVVWIIGLVVLGVVVTVAAVVAIVPARRRRSTGPSVEPAADHPRPSAPRGAPPMSGLESALARVTDRDGRPIGERLDAEAGHVDDLRVPDDTGPLLRRALDHVEHHDPHTEQADGDARSDGSDTSP